MQDGTEKDPWDFNQRSFHIIHDLKEHDYFEGEHYAIIPVPNITHITYGRNVGYTIEEELFDREIEKISSTEIRKNGKTNYNKYEYN